MPNPHDTHSQPAPDNDKVCPACGGDGAGYEIDEVCPDCNATGSIATPQEPDRFSGHTDRGNGYVHTKVGCNCSQPQDPTLCSICGLLQIDHAGSPHIFYSYPQGPLCHPNDIEKGVTISSELHSKPAHPKPFEETLDEILRTFHSTWDINEAHSAILSAIARSRPEKLPDTCCTSADCGDHMFPAGFNAAIEEWSERMGITTEDKQ